MKKTVSLGIRISPDVKAALDQAARVEGRTGANMIDRILSEWLRWNGYLPMVPSPTSRP